jgi:hypothetical protein
MYERGKAAGFPAPRPGPGSAWTLEGSEFTLLDIAFNADATFNVPGGRVFQWFEEFYGLVGNVVVSKEVGPNGHLQLKDRSVIWVNRDEDYWYTSTIQALPAPLQKAIILAPPPLEEWTLIFKHFGASDPKLAAAQNFFAHVNGGFEYAGYVFDADSEIDWVSPTTGTTIRRKAGSGVVCIDDGLNRNVLIFARPGLKRLLAHPSGWFAVKVGYGHIKSMNGFFERFLWGFVPKAFLILFTLSFYPIAIFTLPVLLFLVFHSGKLRLPKSFVNNEEVKRYYPDCRIHTVVEASHINIIELMELFEGKSS